MVVRCVPAPPEAQRKRVDVLWPRDGARHGVAPRPPAPSAADRKDGALEELGEEERGASAFEREVAAVRAAVAGAHGIDGAEAPLVAFVSKMVAVERGKPRARRAHARARRM